MEDTCGTGGDGANTFNISTAVAFVASSCGVKIAKHGNKSASGKVGSADVLLNLGLNLNCSLEKVISAVNEIGITFLFAPIWHKSLVKLAPLRKALGIRTVFNQLGPLVNPLRPNAQVLGVASEDLLEPMGSALLNMGMNRAIVVHGSGGLDEASLQGENKLLFVDKGKLRFSKINISDFNQENISNKKLVVNDSDSNEDIFKSVLDGSGQKSHKNVVALNAALVLWAAGIEDDLHKGFIKALFSINKGDPWEKFLLLKNFLNSDEIISNL
jgi:anthranilate phosphoribosyltransferase